MKFLSFDLETTGKEIETARIVEIAIRSSDGATLLDTRINPGIPIEAEATEVHGITDDDVKGCKPFKEHALDIATMLAGQAVAGFRSNGFDVPILCEEFARAGCEFDYRSVTWIDVGNLFTILDPRTLVKAVSKYVSDEAAKDYVDHAHGAKADAWATDLVLNGMIGIHPDILGGKTPAELATIARFGGQIADPAGKFYYDDEGALRFSFGKHKGAKFGDETGYARWMLDAGFPITTKQFINRELSRLAGKPKR